MPVIDIRFIKECRQLKKEASTNIQWLKTQIAFGHWSEKFKKDAEHLITVYEDQMEMAESMIRDELSR